MLKALSRCVKQVPHRDTLILAGDFNSSLTRQPRLIGPAATSPQEKRPDEPELSNFLGSHRLVALNTWHPLTPFTYVQGDIRTQIDFILTREISAGRQAKHSTPLQNLPLGKKGGHSPIQASITPVRHWHLPGPQIKPLQHSSAALQDAVRARFLAEVDQAIAKGDQHVAYQTLKLLKPWKPALKAQLKDSAGFLLSPFSVLKELGQHATSVFAAHPRLPDIPCRSLIPVSSPGISPPSDGLTRADLCLIPKPGKPADKPAQLRPLGILRPDAKGLAGTAKELLEPLTLPYMRPLPQFAYLPGRGLSDAQSRVVQLREVRELCRAASPSRTELQRGHCPADLVGGITFALDLSQAFDTVSRSEILSLLAGLGADASLYSA